MAHGNITLQNNFQKELKVDHIEIKEYLLPGELLMRILYVILDL